MSEKISQMPAAGALTGAEKAPLVQGGNNVHTDLATIKAFVAPPPDLNDYDPWVSTTVYTIDDRVTYQDKLWRSLTNPNQGNPPVEGVTWTEVSKGATKEYVDSVAAGKWNTTGVTNVTTPTITGKVTFTNTQSIAAGATTLTVYGIQTGAANGFTMSAANFYTKASHTSGTVTQLIGIYSNIENAGTGTVTYSVAYMANNLVTGISTTAEMVSFEGRLTFTAAGTVTTYYGLRLTAPAGSGTVTTKYGLYIEDSGMRNLIAGTSLFSNSVTTVSTTRRVEIWGVSGGDILNLRDNTGATERLRVTDAGGFTFTGTVAGFFSITGTWSQTASGQAHGTLGGTINGQAAGVTTYGYRVVPTFVLGASGSQTIIGLHINPTFDQTAQTTTHRNSTSLIGIRISGTGTTDLHHSGRVTISSNIATNYPANHYQWEASGTVNVGNATHAGIFYAATTTLAANNSDSLYLFNTSPVFNGGSNTGVVAVGWDYNPTVTSIATHYAMLVRSGTSVFGASSASTTVRMRIAGISGGSILQLYDNTNTTVRASVTDDGTTTFTSPLFKVKAVNNSNGFIVESNSSSRQIHLYYSGDEPRMFFSSGEFIFGHSSNAVNDGGTIQASRTLNIKTLEANFGIVYTSASFDTSGVNHQFVCGLNGTTSTSSFMTLSGNMTNAAAATVTLRGLVVAPTLNLTGAGPYTVYGIFYNPTVTSITNTTHYGLVVATNTARNGFGMTTPTAVLDVAASDANRASLRIRSGVAPSAPNDGDIWNDGSDLKVRLGGVTYTLTKA